jgi:hypothetical protein
METPQLAADSPARRCSTIVGYMCGPRIYRFGGWLFERPAGYGTPWPIKEDGTPYKRAGRVFWKMVDRFERMSNEKREACREGGGCVPLIQSNPTGQPPPRFGGGSVAPGCSTPNG